MGGFFDIVTKVFDPVKDVLETIQDPIEDILGDWGWLVPGVQLLYAASAVVGFIVPDIPDIGSPTYGNAAGAVANTMGEGYYVSRCYGLCKIGGNKLRFNAADDSDLRVIVAHCLGEVGGITEWYINDIAWGDLTGTHTKTEYTGTRAQTADARFSDKACAYRSMAYTAFTFQKDDKQVGYDPNIVVTMQALKCLPLAGGATAFTRNPGVILYDWYLNVEGYSADDLNLNSFKSLEELCDEVPTGSSLPRYRFDFNFDTNMSINDAKKLIWQSFNGRAIMSQGTIKCVWDSAQEADGAGSLQAKSTSHAFDMDNIVKGSFSFRQIERPNIVRIHYLDSDKNYKKTSVELSDENDIEINGEILHEEKAWYITNAELARRRCKFKFNKFKYTDYECSLTGFSDSGDLEVLDKCTVTHTLAGWTTKEFLVIAKSENEYGQPQFTLQAYHSGVYDDSQTGVETSYESNLPNPFVAVAVTGTTLTEGGYIAGDGTYQIYVSVTFTKPDNSLWLRGQIWISTDGTNYEHYGDTATGESPGYKIEAAGAGFGEGDTLYVKVLSENVATGVVQALADVSAVTTVIAGKSALPSNVTGFSVSQIGDVVIFTMNRPSQGTDADFSHFEIRQGSSWTASQLIDTPSHTKYLLSDFTAGSKTYMIKAVDTSGNKSETEASVNITLTAPSIQNIYYEREKTDRIGAGTVSNVVRIYSFNSLDGGFFVNGTAKMNDSGTAKMNDSATARMWAPGYDSGYLETEAIDVGASVTGSIYLDIVSTDYLGAEYSVQYKTSTNGADYTAYSAFVNGAAGTFRYIIFKITLTVDRTNYPNSNIKLTGLYNSIDLPTIKNSGVNVTIAAAGTTITFDNSYTTATSIKIKMNVVSATALIPTHELKTITNFKAHVFDTDAADVGGTIDWEAEGY